MIPRFRAWLKHEQEMHDVLAFDTRGHVYMLWSVGRNSQIYKNKMVFKSLSFAVTCLNGIWYYIFMSVDLVEGKLNNRYCF